MRSSPHLEVLTKLCLEIEFRKGIVIIEDLQTYPLSMQSHLTSSSLQVFGFEDYVEEAIACKNEYDVKLIGLMNQYGIETEAKLMGGNILRLSRHFRKQFGEVKQRIHLAVNLLKREARAWFFGQQGDEEECCQVDHFAKASAWYHVTYHPDYFHNDQFSAAKKVNLHLLSFPWVISDILFRIKGN
jgi:RNA-dependent RNA polymerase